MSMTPPEPSTVGHFIWALSVSSGPEDAVTAGDGLGEKREMQFWACLRCGASVIEGEDGDGARRLHEDWHRRVRELRDRLDVLEAKPDPMARIGTHPTTEPTKETT
jgi:hypothetical protein